MKLKIIEMSIENCLKLTHRYITMEALFKDIDPQIYSYTMKKIAPDFMYEVFKIPLIIFLRDEGNITAKASSEIKGLENLFSIFVLDITYILNPELLIFYRLFLNKSQEKNLAEIQINVILINDEIVKDVNFDRYKKTKLLMDLISFTKPNSSSLNVDLLEKIYGENELDFFGLTSIKKLFPRNRKASIVKSNSDIENPWLNLYLQPNKAYLSFENSVNPKKEIKVIHCPICAKECKIEDDLIKIEDNNIHFNCSHHNTQFAKYDPFKISYSLFSPDVIEENDIKKLQYFFKNNVRPINIDSIYMIKILTPGDKPTFFPLKKFMKFKSTTIDLQRKSIFKKFLCPICGKSYLIYFTDESRDDYIDINNVEYIHFSKMFINGDRIVFNCDHSDTLYDMYKHFSIKSTKLRTFMEQAVLMTERYSANFMDGKKVIVQVIDNDTYIIDMANYL